MRDSRRGEIITILAIGAFVVVTLSAAISSFFANNNKTTTANKAHAAGSNCTRFPSIGAPDTAPAGYYWEADCDNTRGFLKPEIKAQRPYCVSSSECNSNVGNPDSGYIGHNPDRSGFCYSHFSNDVTDQRCMMLRYAAVCPQPGGCNPPASPTPQNTQGPTQGPTGAPSCNNAIQNTYYGNYNGQTGCFVLTTDTTQVGCYIRQSFNPERTPEGCEYRNIIPLGNGQSFVRFDCGAAALRIPGSGFDQVGGLRYGACNVDYNRISWKSANNNNPPAPTQTPQNTPPPQPPQQPPQQPPPQPPVQPPNSCDSSSCTGPYHCVGTQCTCNPTTCNSGFHCNNSGACVENTGANSCSSIPKNNDDYSSYADCTGPTQLSCGVLEINGLENRCVHGSQSGPDSSACSNLPTGHTYIWHWGVKNGSYDAKKPVCGSTVPHNPPADCTAIGPGCHLWTASEYYYCLTSNKNEKPVGPYDHRPVCDNGYQNATKDLSCQQKGEYSDAGVCSTNCTTSFTHCDIDSSTSCYKCVSGYKASAPATSNKINCKIKLTGTPGAYIAIWDDSDHTYNAIINNPLYRTTEAKDGADCSVTVKDNNNHTMRAVMLKDNNGSTEITRSVGVNAKAGDSITLIINNNTGSTEGSTGGNGSASYQQCMKGREYNNSNVCYCKTFAPCIDQNKGTQYCAIAAGYAAASGNKCIPDTPTPTPNPNANKLVITNGSKTKIRIDYIRKLTGNLIPDTLNQVVESKAVYTYDYQSACGNDTSKTIKIDIWYLYYDPVTGEPKSTYYNNRHEPIADHNVLPQVKCGQNAAVTLP